MGRDEIVKRNKNRKRLKRLKNSCIFISLFLAVFLVVLPADAREEPKEEIQLRTVETLPVPQTLPEETTVPTEATLPPETLPPQTEETLPPETEPVIQETIPEETEPETLYYNGVPLYYQTDYPNEIYGSGSVATNGCGITSLAMVATYMTGHEYRPDELADYFGGKAENNVERLEYAADALQLPYEARLNFDETMAELKEGKVAIVLMESESIFTDSQHFIVLAGFNEAGKIIVLDPYEPNYSHWQLKNAFVNGFKPGDICCGFSGGWTFDKSEMPEEPFIYVEEKIEVECRYPGLELTYEEKMLLARMVWVEAQGEPFEGQQAVAEVVLNRLVADNFQSTLRNVIYAEGQFRSVPKLDEAEPGQTQFEAVEQALEGPYVLPIDVVFFATYPVNKNVWGEIGGHVFCYQW